MSYNRVLVVADWRLDPAAVARTAKARAEEGDSVFRIVVPAWLHGLDWAGDPKASIPCAHEQAERLREHFAAASLPTVAVTAGDPDPAAAAGDALAAWPAHEVLLVTSRNGLGLAGRIRRMSGVRVRQVRRGRRPALSA